MSLEREIKKTGRDLRDIVDEAAHRRAAEGERMKRDAAGDAMTPGEKAKSMVNEAKHEVKATVDKTKRGLRDNV